MKSAQGLIGKKIGMHQIFVSKGQLIPVTIVEVLPNVVTQVKTQEKDGYQSLQLAAGYKRENLINKPLSGHLAKAKAKNKRFISEFREMKGFRLGEEVDISVFESGDYVDVQAISKGKGTSGVIKRHNFSRGPMTHGSKHHRAPGSAGISRPDKVWKGQPLPGRKGDEKVTLQNLEILKVDQTKNLLIIRGSFPGINKSFCKIYHALKKTKNQNPVVIYEMKKTKTILLKKPKLNLLKNSDQKNTSPKIKTKTI